MSERHDLKPCPFCGPTACEITAPDFSMAGEAVYAYCGNCGVRGDMHCDLNCDGDSKRQQAARSWNCRPVEAALEAALAAERAKNADLSMKLNDIASLLARNAALAALAAQGGGQ